ncbi:hypothetical protein BH09BAC1_BH09BAC1_17400 [soil metagenome]
MPRYLLSLLFGLMLTVASCNSGSDEVPIDHSYQRIALPDNLPRYDSLPMPVSLAGYEWQQSSRTITEKDCAAEACSEISWQWFVLSQAPSQVLIDSVQRFNWYYLTGIPGAREMDLDSIAASFFKEAKKEIPQGDKLLGWNERNSVWLAAATAKTLTVGGKIWGNYGGEDNYASNLENFEVTTGKHLLLRDIVDQPYDIFGLGEQIFRQQEGIAEGSTLASAGFTFPEDVFYLPETFGILTDGLLFLYAPQEIASYTKGEQYLFIPYTLMGDKLNPTFQYTVTIP